MLNKFFKFIAGYVIISVYGKNPERFINICLRRRLDIWGVEPIRDGRFRMRVALGDFKKLKSVHVKARAGIQILKKVSPAYLAVRYRKRIAFPVCAVLLAALVFYTSERVWTIEINGVKNADIAYLARELEENGVFIGAKKSDIKDVAAIKRKILAENGEIAWLWIYYEGAKARVEVSEVRTPPEITDRSETADIVASVGGVIKSVTTKAGEARVSPGDAVNAGDILISGRVTAYREGEEENYLYVHSLGTVTAYTVHSARMTQPLTTETRTPTGRVRYRLIPEIFGKSFKPFNENKEPFKDYDIKTHCYELRLPIYGFTGLALTVRELIEVDTEQREISEELACDIARDELEERIAGELNSGSELLDTRVEYEKTDSNEISVKCTMNFMENIGITEAYTENTGSEEFDKTTDNGSGGN